MNTAEDRSPALTTPAHSQQRVKLIGQDVIALPVPFPDRGNDEARGASGAVRTLLECGQHPVTEGLQAILRHGRTNNREALHD